jgi:hypothetical protein
VAIYEAAVGVPTSELHELRSTDNASIYAGFLLAAELQKNAAQP